VLRDHRHPLTPADAHGVERGGLAPGQLGDAGVGQLAERRRRLVGLVDHADALAVDVGGAVEVVADGEVDLHGWSSWVAGWIDVAWRRRWPPRALWVHADVVGNTDVDPERGTGVRRAGERGVIGR